MNGGTRRCRCAGRRPRLEAAFSLVELMVVVVILGILAAIGLPAYLHNSLRSKAIEATELLGRIQHAQESYFSEFGQYSDASNDPGLSGVNEGTLGTPASTWWPAAPTLVGSTVQGTDFYSGLPPAWNQLGVRPRQYVHYAFQTIAGLPGVVPNIGTDNPTDLGYRALPITQQGPWFWAAASGDLNHNGVTSRFELSSLRPNITIIGNEVE